MNYYKEYIRYKEKYTMIKKYNLKLQEGGGKPILYSIKNISLFKSFTDIDYYLNPIHGIYYAECNFTANGYRLYHPKYNNNKIDRFIHNTHFDNGDGIVKVTGNLQKISPYDYGKFLAHRYLLKINNITNEDFINMNRIIKLIDRYLLYAMKVKKSHDISYLILMRIIQMKR